MSWYERGASPHTVVLAEVEIKLKIGVLRLQMLEIVEFRLRVGNDALSRGMHDSRKKTAEADGEPIQNGTVSDGSPRTLAASRKTTKFYPDSTRIALNV
jgi:hypothetical protein